MRCSCLDGLRNCGVSDFVQESGSYFRVFSELKACLTRFNAACLCALVISQCAQAQTQEQDSEDDPRRERLWMVLSSLPTYLKALQDIFEAFDSEARYPSYLLFYFRVQG